MKKPNQAGFTGTESLLILLVIAILGFTGYFVWHAKQNTDKSLSAANKSAASQAISGQGVNKSTLAHSTSAAASSDDVQQTTFSKLPNAFKTTYATHARSGSTTCVDAAGNPLNDSGENFDPAAQYIADKLVRIGECNASAIYVDVDNVWTFVAKTQYQYNCVDLEKYSVPVNLGATGSSLNQCLDAANQTVAYPRS